MYKDGKCQYAMNSKNREYKGIFMGDSKLGVKLIFNEPNNSKPIEPLWPIVPVVDQ